LAQHGDTTLKDLQKNGYQEFTPTESAPDLNANSSYNGYKAAQAAAPAGQQNLSTALQAQMAGNGPSLAQGQLTAATQQGLAGQLAASAAQQGSQNPGQMARNLNAEGAASAQSAGATSAQLRGEDQLRAERGLTGISEQQNQQNLVNAGSQNQAAQFSSQSGQNLNAAQQAQYEYTQNLLAGQASQANSSLAGIANTQVQGTNATNAALISAGGGAVNGLGTLLGGLRRGGIVNKPTLMNTSNGLFLTGEAGPEAVVPMGDHAAIVPITPHGLPDGTRALDPNVRALLRHPDFIEALRMATGHPEPLEQVLANGDKR